MISQGKIKLIHSLCSKKGRDKEAAFVAEGPKVVGDLMAVMRPRLLVATEEWLQKNAVEDVETIIVANEELRKVSFLQHPQQVLAVFPLPAESDSKSFDSLSYNLCLALDGVQDPGNLGTIIRIADWFGIDTIFCSHDTADAYNPKVVQATMGSIARVKVHYVDIVQLINGLPIDYPVYGTLLDGKNIYQEQLSSDGLIVMGNEGNGISQSVRRLVNRRLLIPHYAKGRETAESLNVAIATAITCAEFRRREMV